jgi:hypothetical protein
MFGLGLGFGLGSRGARGAAADPASLFYGSAQFPNENGLNSSTDHSAEYVVNGWSASGTGMGGAGADAMWAGASSILAIVEIGTETANGMSPSQAIVGTHWNETNGRSINFRLLSNTPAAGGGKSFRLYIRGEIAASAAWVFSGALLGTYKGPFAVLAFNDGTDGYIHTLDIPTGTWIDGTGVAKPAGWAGVNTFTGNAKIGGSADIAFPNNATNPNNSSHWRGAIGDLLFCDAQLTKDDVEAIVNGAAPVATATARGATRYLHVPLVDGAGALTNAITTTRTGLSLSRSGTIRPGQVLRRQAAATYLTIDRLKWPAFFGRTYGANKAYGTITGTYAGLSGTFQYALANRDGTSLQGWRTVTPTLGVGTWEADIEIPRMNQMGQILVRFSSDESVVGSTHSRVMAGPVVHAWGQSEGFHSLVYGLSSTLVASSLNPAPDAGAETVVFGFYGDGSSVKADYVMRQARSRSSMIGDSAVAIANRLRMETDEPIMVVSQSVNGTSMEDLMDEGLGSRTWADVEARAALVQNVGSGGEYIATGHIIIGWEASYSGSPSDVMTQWYSPFLTGTPSTLMTVDKLDHWLGDGTFTAGALVTVLPCNRATIASATATATDASAEADQRDAMRNYGHLYDYIVGPESIAHKMESEVAGALPTAAASHPAPNDYEGGSEMANNNAVAVLQAIGLDVYKGPVFFETIAAGSGADKVVVSLGPHRPTPGDGLGSLLSGYFTGSQANTAAFTDAIYVKKSGGDPGAGFEASIDGGAWSKANVTSGAILDADTVELTLSGTPATSVSIRYAPGTPGSYSAATITQENWRSGLLHYGGTGFTSGSPEATGFAVSGSNQALTLTL